MFDAGSICVGRSDTGRGFSRIIRLSSQHNSSNVPQSLLEGTEGEACEPSNQPVLFLTAEKPWKENELRIVSSRRVTFLAPLINVTKANRHHNVYPPLQLVIRLQDLRVINDKQPRKRRDAPQPVGGLAHVSARISIPQFLYGQRAALRPVEVGHEPRIVQLHAVPVPLDPRHWITAHLQHCSVQLEYSSLEGDVRRRTAP